MIYRMSMDLNISDYIMFGLSDAHDNYPECVVYFDKNRDKVGHFDKREELLTVYDESLHKKVCDAFTRICEKGF